MQMDNKLQDLTLGSKKKTNFQNNVIAFILEL